MGRPATVEYASLRTCLCNLPLAIHGPLAQRGIAPQSVVVELTVTAPPNSDGTPPQEPVKAYLGWSGFPSQVGSVTRHGANGVAGMTEVVEVDPQFGALLGLGRAGTAVSIELLRDLPVATSVSVSPLSADDWEILETNAAFVEMNLLSQVRAVRQGMIVCCWVGTTLVRFTIDETTPPASPAVVLSSATELLVAPKSRPTKHKAQEISAKPREVDTKWSKVSDRLVRLVPLEVADALDLDPLPLAEGEELEDDMAFVSPALYAALSECLGPAAKCTLQHMTMPTEESLEKARREEHAEGSPQSNGVNGSAEELVHKAEIRVRAHPLVPLEHVWCRQKVRDEIQPAEGWPPEERAFELVKFGAAFSSAERKLRAKEARDKEKRADKPKELKEGQLKSVQAISASTVSPPTTDPSAPAQAAPALAGVAKELNSIKSHVLDCLLARRLLTGSAALAPAPGILVAGLAGAGKTALVRQAARELATDPAALTHELYVDCASLAEEPWPKLKERFKDWFDRAWWHAPTLLVLDNLDRVVQAEQEHVDASAVQLVAQLFRLAQKEAMVVRPIVILATAKDKTAVHPLLMTSHILGHNVPLRGPNKTSRKEILGSLLSAKTSNSNLDLSPDLTPAGVAALTEGYLPIDLRALIDRAIVQSAMRSLSTSRSSTLELKMEDFEQAQEGFVPLSLQDVKLQKTSAVEWADIGGLKETKGVLRETLEWPTKYAQIFANSPLRLRSGLLLYGYPGCGKTLLASAVARECGLNFIAVKGPEILNKYIGASEKSVRDLFDRAQAARPCVLFFDEFDAIAPKRGHDSTGVTDRVVNQLLTQMDGAEGLEGVYVLAATSRPDLIDAALLRPGRLDKSILCGMPDDDERLEILQACTRKVELAPDVDLGQFVQGTEGFSGADLQALVYNAHLESVSERSPESGAAAKGKGKQKEGSGGGKKNPSFSFVEVGGEDEGIKTQAVRAAEAERYETILRNYRKMQLAQADAGDGDAPQVKEEVEEHKKPIERRHLDKALTTTRPSVPREEVRRLGRIYHEFVAGRSKGGLPNGEPSDEVGGRVSLM